MNCTCKDWRSNAADLPIYGPHPPLNFCPWCGSRLLSVNLPSSSQSELAGINQPPRELNRVFPK